MKKQSAYHLEAVSDNKPSHASSEVTLDRESVKKRLQKLLALVEQGSSSQAEAAYDALKGQCNSCDLPDTLAGALEKYLDTTAPPAP